MYLQGVPTSSIQDSKAQLGESQIGSNPEVNRKLFDMWSVFSM